MGIPAWTYFLNWAIISIVFTRFGFDALNKTELSNSVSPLLMCLFKHSLAISANLSSISAVLFSPRVKIPVDAFVQFCSLLFMTVGYLIIIRLLTAVFHHHHGSSSPHSYITIFTLLSLYLIFLTVCEPIPTNRRLLPDSRFPNVLIIHLVGGSSLILIGDSKNRLFPCTVLSIASYITLSSLTISENGIFDKFLLPLASRVKQNLSIFMREKKKGKFIEFAAGMMGTILFQNYFKVTSFDHVIAFLLLAVAWLANLALTRGYGDFGIFNFLLSNVVVGCTVSQFGLRGTTWTVYAVSLLLFGIRLRLESLALVQNDSQVGFIVEEN